MPNRASLVGMVSSTNEALFGNRFPIINKLYNTGTTGCKSANEIE